MKRGYLITITCALIGLMTINIAAQETADNNRKKSAKLMKDGNFKEAFEIYQQLLNKHHDAKSATDLQQAQICLQKLNRVSEVDALVQQTIKQQPTSASLLHQAGTIYTSLPHYGYIIAGTFRRGNHRGGGQYSDCTDRDRIQAIQLCLKAIKHWPADGKKTDKSQLYYHLAAAVSMSRHSNNAWKLQVLSDLTQLPDHEPGSRWNRGGRNPKGAPVNAEGNPLFYQIPDSWDAAKNDGERWRYALDQVVKLNPEYKDSHLWHWAGFLHSQFGVTTMAHYNWFRSIGIDDQDDQKGILQLHTLTDDETVARLATGVKRFKLPADQNFITIYKELSPRNQNAADRLIQIYLDRRQYEKAAKLLQQTIAKFDKGNRNSRRNKLLQQIVGNWGRIGYTTNAFPAGTEPELLFTFRNATAVTLVVKEVDLTSMVNNLWKYIESNPTKLNYQLTHWGSLGNTLVNTSRKKYVGKEVGRRTHTLKPRDHHWDTSATLSIPIKKAGAYLVSAELEDGTTTHTVVWLDATVIVKKSVQGGELLYVADAVTGKIIPSANIEFFGYQTVYRKKPGLLKKYDILSKRITKTTGKDGTLFIKNGEFPNQYRWMTRATTDQGIALLGFNRIHSHTNSGGNLSGRKSFGITDRPVYQPNQKVYGKFWIREARYELTDISTFADKEFTINIQDPTGSEIVKNLKARTDAYGGLEYTYDLPEDAKLGQYSVQLRMGRNWFGNHSFRVEEYKKPEYEVIVDAPKDPVNLGETFNATVKAKYYHGAPVTDAKVKIKVLRRRHNDLWFPYGRWDWLYGGGYGWLDIERPWYPGWHKWGCFCPRPFWWHRGGEQPEIVLEQELDIGPDGTVKVEVDTALAKTVHGDTDHNYEVTAEVVDASRRTIVGKGNVVAARKPYQVNVWLDRGYALVGDPINATIAARTALGKEVVTDGHAILYHVSSNNGKLEEKEVQRWEINTTEDNNGTLKFQAGTAGQYRLSAQLKDRKGRSIEGAILFTVRGDNKAEEGFKFSDIELIPDKRTYTNGSTVKLLINTKQPNSTVLLSIRGGAEYRFIHITGQSTVVDIPVSLKDMPNFFVEAATISNARVHTAIREIIVPPEKRILNVEVLPSHDRFKPRAEGKVKVRVTDQHGEPVQGSLALTIYDKSLEYISGGSNVGDIKSHFWKWRRYFRGGFIHSLSHHENNILRGKDPGMRTLGAFGHSLAGTKFLDAGGGAFKSDLNKNKAGRNIIAKKGAKPPQSAAVPLMETADKANDNSTLHGEANDNSPEVMIRKDFADLIKWIGSVETNNDGVAEVPVTFPDNLTTWKIKTWAMAHGTRVGEGSTEVITSKDLIIRLQAPRFFIEKDEVILSAIVHNYLKTDQTAKISLELEGGTISSTDALTVERQIKAGGETRIDWRSKVTGEGVAIVRMKVITADDSDAMEMTYPVYVHGILKQEAWSRVIAGDKDSAMIEFNVPAERRPDQTRLEVRYSPTIAGSIVDALPYLVEYPYGCTEQTLNRFVPTVIAQKLIREMGVDLEDVRNKRANLNPQEIGDDKERMAQWKRWQRNPVFSEKEVRKMTASGVKRLREMQLSNGGWGWFSGWGERAYPHTTAVVVHGLLIAKSNGAKVDDGMLDLGVTWLKNYEAIETEKIRMWEEREKNTKPHASAMDALVRLVLAEAKHNNQEMLGYLFRDKNQLSVYAKAITGMALHLAKDNEKRDAIIRNIEQFLVYDDENQSAHLNLGNRGYWWYWYGSEMEAHAWYLKLLAATNPKSKQARGLVKYLINNRKHATYWNSTRDTAYCIEAIADYMRASGENNPNTEVTVIVDGKEIKTVQITKENLFSYDNKVVIAGDTLGTGKHKIEIKRKPLGKKADPLYTNAYLTVFTKEDFIKKAGLEVKVDRAYYKLERIEASENTAGTQGQVVNHKVEKYKRIQLKPGDMLVSGDLVEVELHIHSKNDYEYLMFNDWKPAGLEAVNVRSGYTRNGMHAYMEMRHEKTSFFVRQLARGSHSLKYRLRAEIPGSFSALPTQAEAMYAPELKANSDEMKIKIKDK